MDNIQNKVVLSCRIDPDLKEELITEAAMLEMPLSSFIESLLIHRGIDFSSLQEVKQEDHSGNTELIAELQSRVEALQQENSELKASCENLSNTQNTGRELELQNQLEQLEKAYVSLGSKYKDLLAQQESRLETPSVGLSNLPNLPNWLSKECYDKIVTQLQALKKIHKEYSQEELLLSAVAVTLRNEQKSFVLYKLRDLWKSNPYLMNLKNQVQ